MFVLDDGALSEAVAAGASIRALAELTGTTVDAVRLRLAELGLQTARQRVMQAARAARALGETRIALDCPEHGTIEHRMDARGSYRCPACNTTRVARRRKTVKETLVAEAGGRCALCGYDRCARALGFHHIDPGEKSFGIALGGVTRSLERARVEAGKCVLLCANCHMEVEAGVLTLDELGGWDSNPQPPD